MNRFQLFSLFGILGALMMFTGDMLLYYEPVSGPDYNSILRMSTMPINRLIAGGLIGPIASIFFILGGYLFYILFKPINKLFASILFALFAIIYILAGTYHSMFPNFGFVGRLSADLQPQQLDYIHRYLDIIYSIMLYLGIIWTALLFYLVIFKKSLYPKWLLIFTPTILVLLSGTIRSITPYPLGAIIYGGWLNLSYLIFFTVSLIHFRRKEIIKG